MSKSPFLGITEQHVLDDLKHRQLQTNDQTSAFGTAPSQSWYRFSSDDTPAFATANRAAS